MNPAPIKVSKVPCATIKTTVEATFGGAIRAIQSDRFRPAVRWVRDCIANQDEDAAREAKLGLPALMPSGLFSEARGDKCTRYSGMICADLDDLEDLDDARAKIADLPEVCGWFVSPSGTGLKAFAMTVAQDRAEHWRAWCSVRARFAEVGLTLDPRTADLPRLCFVSWDPDAVIRDATPLPLLPLAQCPAKPVREKSTIAAPVDASATIHAAVQALAEHGPAVQGSGGDWHTMRACQIGHDFGIPAVDWWPHVLAWNATCRPPWKHDQLRRKLMSTYANSKGPFGAAGMLAGLFG